MKVLREVVTLQVAIKLLCAANTLYAIYTVQFPRSQSQ